MSHSWPDRYEPPSSIYLASRKTTNTRISQNISWVLSGVSGLFRYSLLITYFNGRITKTWTHSGQAGLLDDVSGWKRALPGRCKGNKTSAYSQRGPVWSHQSVCDHSENQTWRGTPFFFFFSWPRSPALNYLGAATGGRKMYCNTLLINHCCYNTTTNLFINQIWIFHL